MSLKRRREDFDAIVVQKYGGSSVATPKMIRMVANRILSSLNNNSHLVVILSAMGETTDRLVDLAQGVSDHPGGREMDLLLATGEQVSVSLLGLALKEMDVPVVSLSGSQCGIRTDRGFNLARIQSIDTKRILEELKDGRVVIIPGFQGLTSDDELTTLGRGGSDVTGAAMAAALGASVCEIYTDVDGVLSADPNMVPEALKWSTLTFKEAIEMASSGAKVLHPRATAICMAHDIPIHVRSSFHMSEGTWISGGGKVMEQAEVVGVSSDKQVAKVTLLDIPNEPGMAAKIFKDLASENISVRLIIQSSSSVDRGRITFIPDADRVGSVNILVEKWKKEGITTAGIIETEVVMISIIGSRLASTPKLISRMFNVLAAEKINIDCISSSEMRLSCVISVNRLSEAIRAIHKEFFPKVGNINNSKVG